MSIAALHAKKKSAERMRSEWILSLSAGYITAADLIRAACTDEHKPLLRLSLRRVLINQPGWGDVRTKRALNQLRAVLGLTASDSRRLTVSWLLDSRAGGRRVEAWADCLDDKSNPPWPGFPHAPEPKGASLG